MSEGGGGGAGAPAPPAAPPAAPPPAGAGIPAGVGAVTPLWGGGAVFVITGAAVGALALLFRGDDLETAAAD